MVNNFVQPDSKSRKLPGCGPDIKDVEELIAEALVVAPEILGV